MCVCSTVLDVAVGAPSFDGNGRVFIYMGRSEGLSPQHAQVLESPFPSPHTPSAFGYTLRGGTDVDDNGYPGRFTLMFS